MVRRKKFQLISLRKKRRGRPRKRKGYWKLFLALFVIFLIIPAIVAFMWFKKNILEKLPDVSKIENIAFSQTTIITDRNGIVLYKLFDENRKYVKLDKISTNVQNALIAIEDKNFWKNPGIDLQGIIRAAIHDIFFGKKQGASTLTQQVIKNLLLTRERTITRKLKEIVLAFKLNDYLENKIKTQYKGLTNEEVKKKVKEKILEIYLNYVFFGNNSYGVQAASETYFHKNASNLSILESAILASIPKSPVKYDPVKNRTNNLGKLEVYNKSGDKLILTGALKDIIQKAYISYLKDQTFSLLKDENDIIEKLTPDNLTYKNYKIVYRPGRKDYVLTRMYLDGYIDKTQFIQAIKEGFDKTIYSPKLEIKAPHFVFYVLNQLEKKYGKDVLSKAGWTIKTSLDYKIQELAEKSVGEFTGYLLKKGANNTALLYVNSENGDILAYVGSSSYANTGIDGQVDMITSKRQCGSVIKPLIYTKAFMENPTFTPSTFVYDTEFDIGENGNTFNNFDGKFLGLLPIRKALPYSRNIPAAKMFFLGGGEKKVKKFLQSLGLVSISNKIHYGYPLAIGAAEVKPLELAQAYIHLSRFNPVKINPILEIRGPSGELIYKKEVEKTQKIVPDAIVSMLWYILSNPANRPPTWNYVMQIPGLKIATKSGTTNIKDKKTGKKLPRDGWFIGYTPTKVFITWAGNTDGKPMHKDAYGGWTAGKVWGAFVKKLQKAGYIKKEDMILKSTSSTYINTLNGKRSSNLTPFQVSERSIANIKHLPAFDDGKTIKMLKIDKLCNGLVSEYTPAKDQVYAYVIKAHSHKPNNPIWEESVQKWWQEKGKEKYEKILGGPVIFEEPTDICKDRLIIAKKGELDFDVIWPKNYQQVSYVFDLWIKVKNTPFKLDKIQVYLDGKQILDEKFNQNIIPVFIPNNINSGEHSLKVVLIDEKGYEKSKTLYIKLKKIDQDKPFLDEIKEVNGKYVYIFKDPSSRVLGGFLVCDGKKIRFRGSVAISSKKNCSYEMVIDYYGNTLNSD